MDQEHKTARNRMSMTDIKAKTFQIRMTKEQCDQLKVTVRNPDDQETVDHGPSKPDKTKQL